MRLILSRALAVAAVALFSSPVLAAENLNAGLEDLVRTSFADAPEMIPIAKCESGYRQFTASGAVLRGGPRGQYLGLYQIDEDIHAARGKGMGLDIYTPEGNIGYAKWLHSRQGTVPWKNCAAMTKWSVPAAAASASPTDAGAALSANLNFGMTHAQVALLQRLLNATEHKVADSGPGSPGNETMKFGPLTRAAVRRFQCAKGIVCDGDESTTGYGRVGPRTRAALNAATQ